MDNIHEENSSELRLVHPPTPCGCGRLQLGKVLANRDYTAVATAAYLLPNTSADDFAKMADPVLAWPVHLDASAHFDRGSRTFQHCTHVQYFLHAER